MLRMLIRPQFLRTPIPEGHIQSLLVRAMPPAVMLFVLLVAGLMASAPTARAQNDGAILLFSDSEYTSCSIVDLADEEYTIYIVHVDFSGVMGCDFAIANGSELVYTGENIPWLSIGNTRFGLGVVYEACLTGQILVGTVTYVGTGGSSSCSYMSVVPSGLGEVEAINCVPERIIASRGELVVNPDATCPCEPIVPVEETSWGRIKALYG